MLPDVRWVVAGLLATVILVLGGMGLTARLRNAHDLAATPLQIAPVEPSPWKQAAVSTDQRVIVDVPQRIPEAAAPASISANPDPSTSSLAPPTGPDQSAPREQTPVVQDSPAAPEAQAPVVTEPQAPRLSEDQTPAAEDQTGSIGPPDAADTSETRPSANQSEPTAAAANPEETAEHDASAHDTGEQIAVSGSDHAPPGETEQPKVDRTKDRSDPETTATIPAIEPASSAAPVVPAPQEQPSQPEPSATVTAVSTPASPTAAEASQQVSSQTEASKAAALAKRKARQRRLRRLRAAQQAQQQQAAAPQPLNPFFELFGDPARTTQTTPSAKPSTPTAAQPRSR